MFQTTNQMRNEWLIRFSWWELMGNEWFYFVEMNGLIWWEFHPLHQNLPSHVSVPKGIIHQATAPGFRKIFFCNFSSWIGNSDQKLELETATLWYLGLPRYILYMTWLANNFHQVPMAMNHLLAKSCHLQCTSKWHWNAPAPWAL